MVTLFILTVNDISNELLALINNIPSPNSSEEGVESGAVGAWHIHNARHLFVSVEFLTTPFSAIYLYI